MAIKFKFICKSSEIIKVDVYIYEQKQKYINITLKA